MNDCDELEGEFASRTTKYMFKTTLEIKGEFDESSRLLASYTHKPLIWITPTKSNAHILKVL